MEDALRVVSSSLPAALYVGLNPCSNGRCSARTTRSSPSTALKSLNPCSNGRCSASEGSLTLELDDHGVLILVLMEDALRAAILWKSYQKCYVLILVLMEDALRAKEDFQGYPKGSSLNPYSNGRCSARQQPPRDAPRPTVLILVLMEDALRADWMPHKV